MRLHVANRPKCTIRNTVAYSLRTAARAAGISRAGVLRAIQTGRISAVKSDKGEWLIEPAELHRVYSPVAGPLPATEPATVSNEVSTLQARLEAAEQRTRDKDEVIADLRRRLDAEADERRRLTAVLTDQRTAPAASKPARSWRWWRRD